MYTRIKLIGLVLCLLASSWVGTAKAATHEQDCTIIANVAVTTQIFVVGFGMAPQDAAQYAPRFLGIKLTYQQAYMGAQYLAQLYANGTPPVTDIPKIIELVGGGAFEVCMNDAEHWYKYWGQHAL